MIENHNKHVHKLKRHRFKTGSEVYFCVLDCPLKLSISLALGKKTLCWRCGEPFIMTEYAIRLAKPHCASCHEPKKVKENEQPEMNNQVFNGLVEQMTPQPIIENKTLTLAEKLTKMIEDASKQTEEEEI